MYLQSNNINLSQSFLHSSPVTSLEGCAVQRNRAKITDPVWMLMCRDWTNELWTNVFIMDFLISSSSWPPRPLGYGLLHPINGSFCLTSDRKKNSYVYACPPLGSIKAEHNLLLECNEGEEAQGPAAPGALSDSTPTHYITSIRPRRWRIRCRPHHPSSLSISSSKLEFKLEMNWTPTATSNCTSISGSLNPHHSRAEPGTSDPISYPAPIHHSLLVYILNRTDSPN